MLLWLMCYFFKFMKYIHSYRKPRVHVYFSLSPCCSSGPTSGLPYWGRLSAEGGSAGRVLFYQETPTGNSYAAGFLDALLPLYGGVTFLLALILGPWTLLLLFLWGSRSICASLLLRSHCGHRLTWGSSRAGPQFSPTERRVTCDGSLVSSMGPFLACNNESRRDRCLGF